MQILTVRDGNGVEQTLKVTEEHPFYRESDGWTPARKLDAGDIILGADGPLTVVSNEAEQQPGGVTVYNLEVEQAHTYFVLAEDATDAAAVWVHNANYPSIRAGDIDTYQSFKSRSRPWDNVEGHELLQHAWLKAHGHATTRLSSEVSKANPVIALRKGGHARIRPRQDGFDLRNQTARDNILANRQIMLDLGYSRKSVNKLTRRALDLAQEFGL